MEWKTMTTPDLVIWQNTSLTLKISHIKGKLLKFLIFNSRKWRPVTKIKTLLVSAIIAKSQDTGKEIVNKFKHFRCLQLSNLPFQHPPNAK